MRSAQVSAPNPRSTSRRVALMAALLAIGASFALCYVVGTRMRAQMLGLAAEAVAQENLAFCAKFGMGPGTAGHAGCVEELAALRARHEHRMQVEAQTLP